MATTLTTADLSRYHYLVVTDFYANGGTSGPKVGDTGVDSTAGIQKAIQEARLANKVLWFPLGTYLVSDTLRAYQFNHDYNNHYWYRPMWMGATGPNGTRPVIKIIAGTTSNTNFNETNNPRPIAHFMCYRPTLSSATGFTEPTVWTTWHPNTVPPQTPPNTTPWENGANITFANIIHNIDFDTSGFRWADGLWFGAAQKCVISNIKITATGSNIGLQGGGGRASAVMNLEIIGGQYSIDTRVRPSLPNGYDGAGGMTFTGLKLTTPVVSCFYVDDHGPMVVVGFDITINGTPVIQTTSVTSTTRCVGNFSDGKITDISGTNPIPFNNTNKKTMYIRNVYVTGTTNLIKTGSTTTTGTGTYKIIQEYACNDPAGTNANAGSTALPHRTSINGAAWNSTEVPVNSIGTTETPPRNFILDHIIVPPMVDHGPMIIVGEGDYIPSDLSDWSGVINQAIIDAESEGHNRVFIPANKYFGYEIRDTIHMLKDTKLFGTSHTFSPNEWGVFGNETSPRANYKIAGTTIRLHKDEVAKHVSTFFMIDTEDATNGTAQLAWLNIGSKVNKPTRNGITPPKTYTGYPSYINWRTGPNTFIYGITTDDDWEQDEDLSLSKTCLKISGNGGGKFYNIEVNGWGGKEELTMVGEEVDVLNSTYTRGIFIVGTTTPIWLYGCQAMMPKVSQPARANIEIHNASNVRIYNGMHESNGPALVLVNSTNIAKHGGGSMRPGVRDTAVSYIKISGTSDDLLISTTIVQTSSKIRNNVLTDSTTSGAPDLAHPYGVCLYKKGTIDDSAMLVSPTTPGVTFDNPLSSPSTTFYPGNTIEVTASPAFNFPINKLTLAGGDTITATTGSTTEATFVIPAASRFRAGQSMQHTRMATTLSCTVHAGIGTDEQTATANLTIAAPTINNFKLVTLATAYSGWAGANKIWTNPAARTVDDAAVGDDILARDILGTNKLISISNAGVISTTSTPATLEGRIFDVSEGLWGPTETIVYDTVTTNLPDPNNPPDGKQVVELVEPVGGFSADSLANAFSPALIDGDYIIADATTRSGYVLTVAADGTYSVPEGVEVPDNEINTRERFTVQGYDTSTALYTSEKYEYFTTREGATFFVGSPVYFQVQGEIDRPMSIDLADLISDQYGDPLTWDEAIEGVLDVMSATLTGSVLGTTYEAAVEDLGFGPQTFYQYAARFKATDVLGRDTGEDIAATLVLSFEVGRHAETPKSGVPYTLCKNKTYEALPVVASSSGWTPSLTVTGLPTGLTYDSETRTVSGTPTTTGASSVTVTTLWNTPQVSSPTYTVTSGAEGEGTDIVTIGAGPYPSGSIVYNTTPNLVQGDKVIYDTIAISTYISYDEQTQESIVLTSYVSANIGSTGVVTLTNPVTSSIHPTLGEFTPTYQLKYTVYRLDTTTSAEETYYRDSSPPTFTGTVLQLNQGQEDVHYDVSKLFTSVDPTSTLTVTEVGDVLSDIGLAIYNNFIDGTVDANEGQYIVTLLGTESSGEFANGDLIITVRGSDTTDVTTPGMWVVQATNIIGVNDAWMKYLADAGFPEGSLNDRMYAWLSSLQNPSYYGSLSDMLSGWIRDNLKPHV